MKELANEIQVVLNTLNGGLEMPATYQNCATLVACMEKLVKVRDAILSNDIEIEVGEADGNTDSE